MIAAAFRYFVLIFALGFLLGTARAMAIQPAIGETWALAIEAPVMLLASLVVARQSLAMYKVTRPLPALGMGLIAFALLMMADGFLAWQFYRQTPIAWIGGQMRWPALVGFAAQLAFAFIPLLIAVTRGQRSRL